MNLIMKNKDILLIYLMVFRIPGGSSGIQTKCLNDASRYTDYIGCFSDDASSSPNGTRLFPFLHIVNGIYDFQYMTNDVCILMCLEQGFLYAGTQAGSQCFCGNDPYEHSFHYKVDDWQCYTYCPGDLWNTNCGGPYRMTVYSTGLSISKSTRIGQSYRRIGTSVQIPGDYLEIHQTVDQFHCALLCNMNSSCKMFSQKENDCKLYNSSSSSGLCYEVAVGPMISLGEDIYIPQI
ncbi:sialate:O-sulfotransferase 2-like [Mytilus edulis]|uniref:sialate:O-sulfotransferase 2-like n=1 Tax=Mytilus edulis TaxID=6550 RepID=UPI0039EEB85A